MISATGRMPVTAAPQARPAIASSEIGVSRTRSGPNSLIRFSVTPKMPPPAPQMPISSPSRKTVGSRRISSRSASFSACEIVSSRTAVGVADSAARVMPALLGVDVVLERLGRGLGALLGELDRGRELGRDLALDRVGLLGRQHALPGERVAEARDRVALPPLLDFVAAAVALAVADVVTLVAVGVGHDQGRALAAAAALGGV